MSLYPASHHFVKTHVRGVRVIASQRPAEAIAGEAYTMRSRTMGSTSLASNSRCLVASPPGHRFKNVKPWRTTSANCSATSWALPAICPLVVTLPFSTSTGIVYPYVRWSGLRPACSATLRRRSTFRYACSGVGEVGGAPQAAQDIDGLCKRLHLCARRALGVAKGSIGWLVHRSSATQYEDEPTAGETVERLGREGSPFGTRTGRDQATRARATRWARTAMPAQSTARTRKPAI